MTGAELLAGLSAPSRRVLDAAGAVLVVAHPDDETLAVGGQLHRLRGLRLVMVTDGAPRNPSEARRHGFADAPAYAAARRHELTVALACGGFPETRLTTLAVPDQGATRDLGGL